MNTVMRVSPEGRTRIKLNEGLRLSTYSDTVGINTIAYGRASTNPKPVRGMLNGEFYQGRVVKGLTITQAEAERCFDEDLAEIEKGLSGLITVDCSQGVFDAVADMTYQFGLHRIEDSKLLKVLNFNPRSTRVMDEIMRWVRAGGKPQKGLYLRRCMNVCQCFGLPIPKVLNDPRAFPWEIDAAGEIAAGTMPIDMVVAMARNPDLPPPHVNETPDVVVVHSAAAESAHAQVSVPASPVQPEAQSPPDPLPDSRFAPDPPVKAPAIVEEEPTPRAPTTVNTPLGPLSSDGKDWYRSQTVMGGILQAVARVVGRLKAGIAAPGAFAALTIKDPVVQALATTILMICAVYLVEHWGEIVAHKGRKKAAGPLKRT